MKTDIELAVKTLRQVVSSGASWILFENGTCLFSFFSGSDADLETEARGLLFQHGPVHVGSSSADFSVSKLSPEHGWIVAFDYPDMLTLVLPLEGQGMSDDATIGVLGREKRALDAKELQVVHIENRGRIAT